VAFCIREYAKLFPKLSVLLCNVEHIGEHIFFFTRVAEEKIFFESDELRSVELLQLVPGDTVYVFHGVDSFAVAEKVRHRIEERAREEDAK